MFYCTLTKPGLRQAGALALCAVCLCGAVTAAVHFSGETVTAGAAADPGIETTQDIGTYFTGYGFETDLATAAVDKVKIPKKWDDSFAAFNQVIQESDLDLSGYKGKKKKKWTLLCPQLSTGDQDTFPVSEGSCNFGGGTVPFLWVDGTIYCCTEEGVYLTCTPFQTDSASEN